MKQDVMAAGKPSAPPPADNRPWYKKVKPSTWFKAGAILAVTFGLGGFVEDEVISHRGVYRFSKFVVIHIRDIAGSGNIAGFPILWGSSLAVGAFAYLIRQNIRDLYGIVEILIGSLATASTSYMIANTAGPPDAILLSQGLALSGGIYIVVRGLDNLVSDVKLTVSSKSASTTDVASLKVGLLGALHGRYRPHSDVQRCWRCALKQMSVKNSSVCAAAVTTQSVSPGKQTFGAAWHARLT